MTHPDDKLTMSALAEIMTNVDRMVDQQGLCRKCLLMSLSLSCVTTLYGCGSIDADEISEMSEVMIAATSNDKNINKMRNRNMN